MPIDPAVALDFINTVRPPGGGPDVWSAPDAFRTWISGAGLGDAPDLTPPTLRLLLDDAVRLRRALDELVTQRVGGGSTPGMALLEVNRFLNARPGRTLALASRGNGYGLIEGVSASTLRGVLAPVAEAAAHLLAHEDPARIRRCADPACLRWFLDTSKNQRKRWCDMAVCGNRAKARAHARRARRARA
jgi:predicted RNA-binding Zn ribbon-like protein